MEWACQTLWPLHSLLETPAMGLLRQQAHCIHLPGDDCLYPIHLPGDGCLYPKCFPKSMSYNRVLLAAAPWTTIFLVETNYLKFSGAFRRWRKNPAPGSVGIFSTLCHLATISERGLLVPWPLGRLPLRWQTWNLKTEFS